MLMRMPRGHAKNGFMLSMVEAEIKHKLEEAEMTEFIKGRKYRVTFSSDKDFTVGEVVEFDRYGAVGLPIFKDAGTAFTYEHQGCGEIYTEFEGVTEMAEKKQAPKIVGREYVVIGGGYLGGKVVKLVEDDGTDSPLFEVVDSGKTHYIFLTAVLLLADVEAETAVTEEQETVAPEKAKHKYAVGDKFTAINTEARYTLYTEGTEVTVTGSDGHSSSGIPDYKTVDAEGVKQYLLETQLKPVEPVELKAGEFYYSEPAAIQFHSESNIDVLFTESGAFFTNGFVSPGIKWQPATEAQKSQFLAAKLADGSASEADKKLYASLLPMDNPELEVGEVYYRKNGAIIRAEQGDTISTGLTGNYLWETLFVEKSVPGVSANLPYGHRKALPFEVALLEQKELENDVVYVKPLVNDRGTVIEVGHYYANHDGGLSGCKVTEALTCKIVLKEVYTNFVTHIYLRATQKDVDEHLANYFNNLVPATPTEIELFKAVEKVGQLKEELGVK